MCSEKLRRHDRPNSSSKKERTRPFNGDCMCLQPTPRPRSKTKTAQLNAVSPVAQPGRENRVPGRAPARVSARVPARVSARDIFFQAGSLPGIIFSRPGPCQGPDFPGMDPGRASGMGLGAGEKKTSAHSNYEDVGRSRAFEGGFVDT